MPSAKTEEKKINGGYIYLARQILDSDIFHEKPPEWLKIWIYILLSVNYENGRRFSRGTRYFCWDDEKRNLQGITKWQWHECIRFLKKEKMITTQKTTRGNLIKVLQYGRYQNPKFYKTKAQTKARPHDVLTTSSDQPKHNQSTNQSRLSKSLNKNQSTFQSPTNTQPTRNQSITKAQLPQPAPDNELTPPLMKELKNERMKERITILSQIENLLHQLPPDIQGLTEEYVELVRLANKTQRIGLHKKKRLIAELFYEWSACDSELLQEDFRGALRTAVNNEAPHINYVRKVMKSNIRRRKIRLKRGAERDAHN